MKEELDSAVGRPADITDERIIEAGEALVRANRNVTGFALRKMGDRKDSFVNE
ncbi:hypothetical protein [Methylomonas sp. DH-1]|uniref:hypothetical protein n=1 Tax=Methylomonas sp. (strain DH-1) TaxID=1727196 RepID=UPI000B166F3C|nr:hypothetical protein [Methylomonas sp. DH-1]